MVGHFYLKEKFGVQFPMITKTSLPFLSAFRLNWCTVNKDYIFLEDVVGGSSPSLPYQWGVSSTGRARKHSLLFLSLLKFGVL